MNMKHLLYRFSFFILLFLLSENQVFLQIVNDTSTIWRIETADGNVFFGPVLSKDTSCVTMNTKILGIIIIPVDFIKDFTAVEKNEIKKGEVWMKNPQAARYFYAPNGYGLEKGKGYYQNTWVLFNQVSYGISDNLSLGAGLLPLFLFAGTATPVWITPKLSIPVVKEKFNAGLGLLLAGILGEDSQVFGIAYCVGTLGNHDRNITAGMGYGFYDGNFARRPLLNLSGMLRITRKGYLLTENYYFSSGEGNNIILFSLGGRTVWTRLSLDYGLFLPIAPEITDQIVLPWLGFTLPLGRNKKNL
jgi:hypothetical protein